MASHHVETIPETKVTMACKHLRQLHEATANQCTPAPSPSKAIKVLSKRQLPLPGELRKEDILDQYADTFKGLGQLGPPVHQWQNESAKNKLWIVTLNKEFSSRYTNQPPGAPMN